MNATERYLHFLLERGRPLVESLGIEEVALSRKDALEAIQIAAAAELLIQGGDVFFDDGKTIRPAYANWYVLRSPNENHREFSIRSIRESLEYVSKFSPPPGQEAFFSIVANS